MTWGQANHIHSTEGHSVFIERAEAVGKSKTFVWNVCTNQKCGH